MREKNKLAWLYCASLALAGLLSPACQQNAVEKPTFSEEKMIQIMADLTLADAATLNLGPIVKDSVMHVYFNQVFELHGTTLEEYEKNLRLFSADLAAMERITTQVDEKFGVDKK